MPPEIPGQMDFEGDEEPEHVPWLVEVGKPDKDGNFPIYSKQDPDNWIKFGLTPDGRELVKVDFQGFLTKAEFDQASKRAAAALREARETGRFKEKKIPPVVRDQRSF